MSNYGSNGGDNLAASLENSFPPTKRHCRDPSPVASHPATNAQAHHGLNDASTAHMPNTHMPNNNHTSVANPNQMPPMPSYTCAFGMTPSTDIPSSMGSMGSLNERGSHMRIGSSPTCVISPSSLEQNALYSDIDPAGDDGELEEDEEGSVVEMGGEATPTWMKSPAIPAPFKRKTSIHDEPQVPFLEFFALLLLVVVPLMFFRCCCGGVCCH